MEVCSLLQKSAVLIYFKIGGFVSFEISCLVLPLLFEMHSRAHFCNLLLKRNEQYKVTKNEDV